MGVLALAVTSWTWARLPETLRAENRRPFTLRSLAQGFAIVLSNRLSVCYTLAFTAIFGALFGFINSAQQIYIGIYSVGAWFPVLFAAVAGPMAVSSFLNARFVGRFGMRRLAHGALLGFIGVTGLIFVLALAEALPLWLFMAVFSVTMFQFSWIGSNFNALAMEPLGHVARTASSAQGFVQTLFGGLVGAMIGQAFDGTVVPVSAGYFLASIAALALVLIAEKGRLFQPHHKPI